MKTYRSNIENLRWAFVTMIALAVVGTFVANRLPSTAQATPSRIAVVDTESIFLQTVIGKAALSKVKKYTDDLQQKADQMGAEVKRLNDAIAAQQASLPASQLTEMKAQRDAKNTEFQRFGSEARKKVADYRDWQLTLLDQRVKPTVDAIGKEMALAAVFKKFDSGLIFVDDSIDITPAVVARVNKTFPTAPMGE